MSRALRAALLGAWLIGAGSAAAVDLDLGVDAATATTARLRLVAAEDTAPLQPSGSVSVQIGIAPGPVADTLTVGPGSLSAANLTLSATGPVDAVDVMLQNVAVTLSSAALVPTATGANRAVVPADAITFEATAGTFSPSGDACTATSFVPRNLSTDPEFVEHDSDGSALAILDTLPLPGGGIDVTLTIPIQAANQVVVGCPPVWLFFDGDLVLRGTIPACSDTLDNDGDGFVDTADPGCVADPTRTREDPQCQNGIDDEGDGRIDFDGGASLNGGSPIAPVDPQCADAGDDRERPPRRLCGLGFELALGLLPLAALRRRHGRP